MFRGLYGDIWIEELLTNLPGGKIGLLLVANLAIFVLGFFIDFFEIAFIIIPLLAPAAKILGIDMVWFGAMVAVCLQTAWLSPPVALSAYFLKGVMSEWQLKDIYLGMVQFLALQLTGLLLLATFPQIALWLPSVLLGR